MTSLNHLGPYTQFSWQHWWAPILSIFGLIFGIRMIFSFPGIPWAFLRFALGVLFVISSIYPLFSGLKMLSNYSSRSLAGKHVFVTGGSQGLGLAVAAQAVAAGAFVTIVARRENIIAEAVTLLNNLTSRAGGRIQGFSADVTDRTALAAATVRAETNFGAVDMLVANAGAAPTGYFWNISVEERERAMALNLNGCLYAIDAVLPGMLRRRSGRIVLVASALALTGMIGYTAYCPTKFALRGLAAALRGDLAGTGVTVHLACPAGIDTPGFAEEAKMKPSETQAIEKGEIVHPPGRVAAALWGSVLRDEAEFACGDFGGALLLKVTAGIGPRMNPVADAIISPLAVVGGYMYGAMWYAVSAAPAAVAARLLSVPRKGSTASAPSGTTAVSKSKKSPIIPKED